MTQEGMDKAKNRESKLWFIQEAYRAVKMNYAICTPWCWEIEDIPGLHRINFDSPNIKSKTK